MIDLNALCTSMPFQGLQCEPKKKAIKILGLFSIFANMPNTSVKIILKSTSKMNNIKNKQILAAMTS